MQVGILCAFGGGKPSGEGSLLEAYSLLLVAHARLLLFLWVTCPGLHQSACAASMHPHRLGRLQQLIYFLTVWRLEPKIEVLAG